MNAEEIKDRLNRLWLATDARYDPIGDLAEIMDEATELLELMKLDDAALRLAEVLAILEKTQ